MSNKAPVTISTLIYLLLANVASKGLKFAIVILNPTLNI